MRDVFFSVLYACGSFSAVAITVALVKAAHDYVLGKLFVPKTQVLVASPAITAGSSTAASWMTVEELPPPKSTSSIARPPIGITKPTEPVDSTFPPPGQSQSIKAQEDFILECGNCHRLIKSPPVTTDSKGGKTQMRYRCETCGATVEVKL